MIIKILTFVIASTILKACSPAPDWVPSTIADQVNHAGAVIYGEVESVIFDNNSISYYVHLNNAHFFKGCGPQYVRVNGYTSSASCGVDPPSVGEKVIVFVCRDGDHWNLNNINLHTGSIYATDENIERVRKLTKKDYICEGCCVVYNKCTRPTRPFTPIDFLPADQLARRK